MKHQKKQQQEWAAVVAGFSGKQGYKVEGQKS
jgi:hypothetical protein